MGFVQPTKSRNRCSRCGSSRERRGWRNHLSWLFPITGLLALIWFVIRVVPKPSRAMYPCQRAAAPLAGGFVLWIAGVVGSVFAFRRGRMFLRHARVPLGMACLVVAAVLGVIAAVNAPEEPARADVTDALMPIGVAKGLNPGRVVWAHDPDATDWNGPGDGHWWEPAHTDQVRVDAMMSSVIRGLAGESTDAAAWDALIRHHNQTHGKGDVGYQSNEKIAIKVNFVGCHQIYPAWGGCNPANHDLVAKPDYMNTSPQVMLALLRQLVYEAGVPPQNISIGDPTCYWADPYYNHCAAEFPEVHYIEYTDGYVGGTEGREGVHLSSVPVTWSSHPSGVATDYLPRYYTEAAYFINLANLKAHDSDAGVTLCGKNHYGSLTRYPVQSGYYDIHTSLPKAIGGMGRYRAVVDLMGHAHTGDKQLLSLIDGLYSGRHPYDTAPTKWNSAPFNGDWTSSLFGSQDMVAIDSVGFDFLYNEWWETAGPHMSGAEDYLHEAALADNPPSGTYYDPDNNGAGPRLSSLGVHEHWNNAQDKQYSRNLGTGDGIELIPVGPPVADVQGDPVAGWVPLTVNFDGSGSFDLDGAIVSYEWDFDGDGTIDDDSGPVTSHVYTHATTYTAALTVTDNDGLTDTTTIAIEVEGYPGDFDDDSDVDQDDFAPIQCCLGSGDGAPDIDPECVGCDLNGDGVIDQTDITLFIGCMSGPGVGPDPDCLDPGV